MASNGLLRQEALWRRRWWWQLWGWSQRVGNAGRQADGRKETAGPGEGREGGEQGGLGACLGRGGSPAVHTRPCLSLRSSQALSRAFTLAHSLVCVGRGRMREEWFTGLRQLQVIVGAPTYDPRGSPRGVIFVRSRPHVKQLDDVTDAPQGSPSAARPLEACVSITCTVRCP